jgi:hypothetical protein
MLVVKATLNQLGDQKTRDHKENINPNEAAFHAIWKGMKRHNGQNRHGPQSVDVGTVMCTV